MNKYIPLTFSLIAVSLTPVAANGSSAEIGYESVTLSSTSLTGLNIAGSLDLSDHFSLELANKSVNTKVLGVTVKLNQTDVGFGYTHDFSDTVDLKLSISRVNQTLTANWAGNTGQADGSSTAFGSTLKVELTDNIDGLLGYSTSTESSLKASRMLGINVGVSDSMDLTFRSSGNSTVRSTALGLRYNF